MLMFLTNESFLNLFKGKKKLQRLFQGWYNIAQFGLVCCFNRDPSLTWQAIPKSRVTFVTVTSSVKKSSRLSGRIKELDFTMRLFLKCFFYHLLIYKLYMLLFIFSLITAMNCALVSSRAPSILSSWYKILLPDLLFWRRALLVTSRSQFVPKGDQDFSHFSLHCGALTVRTALFLLPAS